VKLIVGLLSHLIASAICLVVFTAVPIVLYGILVLIGIAFYDDMGGPLNFVIVPVLSVALALFTTFILLLPITALLQWGVARRKLPRWVPLAAIFPVSFVIFTLVSLIVLKPENLTGALVVPAIWCLIGSVCFAFYWIPLNLSELTLSWLWRRISP
jgi:hypothetical protein